ncbi:uncharacterized protein E6C27_scaffold60G00840 [Cucumis melo var. makuwa]|uniref:Uncharacterized protein n=1 Tax=Cucumis melo var. makuwa TaxID=1194695 RepID=A0A5A7UDY4_CUCMM|nr:uncharacterized protein E6C27_scaffold60G00840 [Cucumis melo var. makuwa]
MPSQSFSRGLTSPLLGLQDAHSRFHQMQLGNPVSPRRPRVQLEFSSKCNVLKRKRWAFMCVANSNKSPQLESSGEENHVLYVSRLNGVEPFHGKCGSVSFHGLSHQLVEEGKLMSSPFREEKGSILWVLAPAAFISSLILPQVFLGGLIEAFFKNGILVAEIVSSLVFEVLFYVGVATFLLVTDRVQRPYLQFSSKRWSLITGLRGYLSTAFFIAGFKVVAPLFAVYVTWPMIGLPALVAVFPFLVGCIVQLAFETHLDRRGSASWPLVPIIFEVVYRLYQLTKAAHFMESLMFQMRGLPTSPELLEKSGALFAMMITFQILGVFGQKVILESQDLHAADFI